MIIRNWFILAVAVLQIAGAIKYLHDGHVAIAISFIGVAVANAALSTV